MNRAEPQAFLDGLRWVGGGFALVWRRPLLWLLLTGLLFGFALLMALLPAVGNVLLYLLSPAILAAMLLVARQLDEDTPDWSSVRTALAATMPTLLRLGLAYTGMQLALLLLLGSAVPGLFDGLTPGDRMPATGGPGREALPMLVLVLALSVPATLLMWFSPALVVFRRMGAWPAMRYSLAACIFHWRACLANGIGVFLLLLLASLPAMTGLLLWVPLMIATLYTSYVAVFGPPGTVPPQGGRGPDDAGGAGPGGDGPT